MTGNIYQGQLFSTFIMIFVLQFNMERHYGQSIIYVNEYFKFMKYLFI